jgi:hypothetical protein
MRCSERRRPSQLQSARLVAAVAELCLVRSAFMQTLTDFFSHWRPTISEQAKDVAAKIEADQNMSRFLAIEPHLRSRVDMLVREYSKSLSAAPNNLEEGYLFHLRLQEACNLAQFLVHCGLGSSEMDASDWIEVLAIDAWHEFTVHKWKYEFERVYLPKT